MELSAIPIALPTRNPMIYLGIQKNKEFDGGVGSKVFRNGARATPQRSQSNAATESEQRCSPKASVSALVNSQKNVSSWMIRKNYPSTRKNIWGDEQRHTPLTIRVR